MQEKQKESLIRVIAKYSSSNIYTQILGLLNAFIRPKLLSPELYGLWHILIVIPKYAAYSTLGTHTIMRYLIPYHDAKAEYYQINEIKGTVFYSGLLIKIFIATVLVLIALIRDMSVIVRLGLLTMAYVVIMEWYYDYYANILKSYQKFSLLSSTNYIQSSVAFAGSATLIYFMGIYGVYLSAVITFIVIISYLRIRSPLGSYGKFRYPVFIDLVKKGVPLMMYNLSSVLISSSDKIIIVYFLGPEQLGYYGIAVVVHGFLMQIPGTSREVIEPRLMSKLHQNSDEENLREYTLKPLINTAYFMPFLIGPVFFIMPGMVSLVLPRYVQGIEPTLIITLGGYFYALIYIVRGIIVANNWQLNASLIIGLISLMNVGLCIFFIKLGLGIKGVAAGCSISFFLLFVSLLVFVMKKCTYAQQDWRSGIMAICWPFPVMCITIFVLSSLEKILPLHMYLSAFLNLFLYSFAILILINIAKKKYELLRGLTLKDIWASF